MKSITHPQRFCIPALVVAGAILLWQGNRSLENEPRANTDSAATHARSAPPLAPAAAASRTARSHPRPANLTGSAAVTPYTFIRSKVRELQEIQTGDTDAQSQVMKELLATLTDENAADLALTLSPEERDTPFGTAVLDRWLAVDLPAAANWIAAQPGPTEEQALVVARKMLGDPAGLQAYCADLPDDAWKQAVLAAAGQGILAKDPAAAVRLAHQMKPGAAQTDLLQTVAYDWTARDPGTALAWITQVEDPSLREGLSAVGAKAIAVTDPDLAAAWLRSAVKSEPVASDTALCIVETWGAQDPATAAAWVAQLPEQGPREAAAAIVLNHWLQSDPAAAITWIQKLPEAEKILAKLIADPDESAPEA
jgi:hypothetical protein